MSDVMTVTGDKINSYLISEYFSNLVNQFFKILPMREKNEETLPVYLESLQMELIGFQHLVPYISESSMYVSLLSILQYLIDNTDIGVSSVRREVFRSISICNKIKSSFHESEV